jgi:hypothetical protein
MLIRLRRFLGSAIGLGLLALCVPDPLGAESQTKSYPVSLQVLAPSSGGNRIPTVTLSGWPIVLKMSTNKEIGIGTQDGAGDFPISGDQGFVVFEEPDDCHSWLSPGCSVNETYFSFTAPIECPQRDPAGGCLGNNVPGAVPSLVLLADAVGGANLAGAFDAVGYELDDTNHQTNVVASLVVPNWFLRTSPLIDRCVGALITPEGPCVDLAIGTIDGSGSLGLGQIVDVLNQNNVTTLRAFVVSGTAPGFLADLDGDAVTGAKDAELAGFRVISREVVFRVRTLYQLADLRYSFFGDLDGNGLGTCEFCGLFCPTRDCAGGGGGLTPVPR